jgi:radical SAM superfamily enzyme YgiQ (UPF0313 family)
MRVLLVYPNADKELIGYMDQGAIAEPISLEYVAAGARQDGHEVRLLDLRLHRDALDETVTEFQPEMVGVTGFSMHVLRNLELCQRVKELVPGCKTAVGGHHATLEPVDYQVPQMDFVMVNEGVSAFREVLRRLDRGEPTRGVPGAWSRVNGGFEYGGDPPEYDMNQLPHPDRSIAASDRSSYFIDLMKPVALMRTTVGCPYRCTFCSLWRIMDGRYYTRDLDDIVEELKQVPEPHVHFADDEPFVNSARMNELADKIEKAGIQKYYYAYSRIDTFLRSQELMEKWYRIGLRRLFFGVESIFDDELETYNKRQHRADIVEALDRARKMGLGLFTGFIVHPSYTEKQFDELKEFVRAHDVEYPSFTVWTPIPGTEDGGTKYDNVIEVQPNGRPDWRQFDLQHAVIPTELPKHEFMSLYGSLYEVSHYGRLAKERSRTTPAPQSQYEAEARRKAALAALARKVLGM